MFVTKYVVELAVVFWRKFHAMWTTLNHVDVLTVYISTFREPGVGIVTMESFCICLESLVQCSVMLQIEPHVQFGSRGASANEIVAEAISS